MPDDNNTEAPSRDEATRAFVDVLNSAVDAKLVTMREIEQTLDRAHSTVWGWLNKYQTPDLRDNWRDQLPKLDKACHVEEGTLSCLYQTIQDARRATRRRKPPDPPILCGGISEIYDSMRWDLLSKAITRASQITILNTFLPYFEKMSDSLVEALRARRRVQVILLNPHSRAAIVRDTTIGPAYSLSGSINKAMADLDSLAKKFEYKCTLEVRVTEGIPAGSIYIADDYILMGWFLSGCLAVDGPQIEIRARGTPMANMAHAEVEAFRANSLGPVPLPDWREWILRHRGK